MTIATFPAIIPNACDWGLQSNTQNARSELNGAVQTLALPGDIWTGTLTFTNKTGSEARTLRTFLASLRGQAGRFYLTPPAYTRAGTGTGTPLVKGASQTGSSVVTDGWLLPGAGQPWPQNSVRAGDYIQIGDELKMVTVDAEINSSLESIIYFVPPIRVSPADNSAVTILNPKGIFMLSDAKQARWQAQPTPIYALSIAVEEALV